MARSPFTLAALAVAAIDGFTVVNTRTYTSTTNGDFDAVILEDNTGARYIMRIPTSPSAETEQSAQVLALGVMTPDIRSGLPFAVPTVTGQVPVDDTRGVIYEFLEGTPFSLADLDHHPDTIVSLGEAIASIHALPTTPIINAGLANGSADSCRTATNNVVGRAAGTGLLPVALLRRWEMGVSDDRMWDFSTVVTHGSLRIDSFLGSRGSVTGILGWSALAVGDPAVDFLWACEAGTRSERIQALVAAYARRSDETIDGHLASRAMLYNELDVARWLLHGKDIHRDDIVSDAVSMLDSLVEAVLTDTMSPLSSSTDSLLSVSDTSATRVTSEPPSPQPPSSSPGESVVHDESTNRSSISSV